MSEKYYTIVIDKVEKTLQIREVIGCNARLEEDLMKEYNIDCLVDTKARFKLIDNGIDKDINLDNVYAYAREYTILESKASEIVDTYEGLELIDFNYNTCKIVKHYKDNKYLAIDKVHTGEHGNYLILSIDDIETLISKQEKFRDRIEKIKQEETERKIKEDKQRKEREEKENLYGFTDNKTALQKGKILSTLMKTMLYNGNMITRKDFIIDLISKGYKPTIKEYAKRRGVKKSYTVMIDSYGSWYDVTKTEYNFANYYINSINMSSRLH